MRTNELIERSAGLDWSSNWESDLFAFVRHWVDDSDSVEVRTSGSTGLPKLIHHTKEAMRQSAVRTCDFLQLKPGMTALLCMSTRNIAGMMMVVRTFERDLNLLTVAPDGHPLKGIPAGTSIDFCAMVPAQVYNSLQVPEERKLLESIRHLIIGGAPVSYALLKQLRELPGSVWATFGMTETISHIALRKLNGKEASEEYTLLEGVKMEVGAAKEMGTTMHAGVAESVGTTKEAGAVGNLIIHASYLSPEPIITNDVVEITGERTFRWLGRQDHVIISGGFKIFPETVEEKIAGVMSRLRDTSHVIESGHDHAVGDAGPVGHSGTATQRYFIGSIPDEKLGEVPVLVIEMPTPENKDQLTREILASLATLVIHPQQASASLAIHPQQASLTDKLPRHELPREILFVEKFIETPTGKIIRSATLRKVIH